MDSSRDDWPNARMNNQASKDDGFNERMNNQASKDDWPNEGMNNQASKDAHNLNAIKKDNFAFTPNVMKFFSWESHYSCLQ